MTNDSDQLRLYGSSSGLGEWTIANAVRAHRTTTAFRWAATALVPKREYVHLKWAVVNRDGQMTAEERFVTPMLWTGRRSLTFKPFGGPPSVESLKMKMLPRIKLQGRVDTESSFSIMLSLLKL